jgi:hypothetical protein
MYDDYEVFEYVTGQEESQDSSGGNRGSSGDDFGGCCQIAFVFLLLWGGLTATIGDAGTAMAFILFMLVAGGVLVFVAIKFFPDNGSKTPPTPTNSQERMPPFGKHPQSSQRQKP